MTIEQARAKFLDWRRDPVKFVIEVFHVVPDAWQVEALRLFPGQEKRREAMQACAGPGKTAVLAWLGWLFMLCYVETDNHPNAAALSIDLDNLKNNLWKEFSVWYGRSELLQSQFEITTERIFHREHPKTWFLAARSYAKKADVEAQGRTLSGLHAPFMLYLIDEAGDINPAVLRSAEQGISNCRWGKILIAGNPTSHEGILHHAAQEQRHLWDVIRITGDPEDPNRSKRIDLTWAKEQIQLYGRENPWVMAFILGKFPPGSINALLSADEVNAALGRGLRSEQFEFSQKRLGVDVARFGDDRTVIAPRQGLLAGSPDEMRNARSHAIAARVMAKKKDWGSEMEFIDSTGGYGAGVEDALLLAGVSIVPVNFSENATDRRFYNKRSEIIWECAEWVKRGACLPNLPGIVREATAPLYWLHEGQLRVQEKDQIKKKLNGHSPDYWDALCTTFAIPDMPTRAGQLIGAGANAGKWGGGQANSEWDPLGSAA